MTHCPEEQLTRASQSKGNSLLLIERVLRLLVLSPFVCSARFRQIRLR